MKRLSAFFAAMVCCAALSHAIPADPTPRKVKQADGSWITVCKTGDEHGSVIRTLDGYPLFYNKLTGNFEYASASSPAAKGSGIVAADANERSPEAVSYLSKLDKETATRAAMSRRAPRISRSAVQRVRINDYPTIGKHNALVILVEFSDTEFSTVDGDPFGYYDGLLNQPGFTYKNGANGSARDYYDACSYGKFAPEFDVIGPVTLPHEATYYGENVIKEVDGVLYSYTDDRMSEFVVDACNAADAFVDFSQYDENNDGAVDNIYFFYAGYGEADTYRDDVIWPHAAKLDADWGVDLSLDGVKISRYACSNEINGGTATPMPVGIGTFVHEFAHVLGLADHYDTGGNSGRLGVQQWDVMAAASYNDNQNTPPAFSAFERAELGWLDYTDITPSAEGLLAVSPLIDEDKAYRIVAPDTDGREYFIIENRTGKGWDRTLPAFGMLVWHIDMDDDAWFANTVNTSPTHQRIDLVEADGTENSMSYAGDVFPGSKGVTSFDFHDWSGANLFSFDYVEGTDAAANFLLARTAYKPEAPGVAVSNVLGRELTLAVTMPEDARRCNVSIYTTAEDGTKSYVEGYEKAVFAASDTVTVTGLEPLTAYTVAATAGIGSYTSAETAVQAATTEVQFVETSPVVTGATNIGEGCFTANWQPLDGAETYLVTLFSKSYAPEETLACGFDGKQLPEGWSSSSQSFSSALFGEKSPSLQLGADGDELKMAVDGAKLTSLEFWYRSQTTGNTLRIERLKDGQWGEIKSFVTNPASDVVAVELDSCDEVRVRFERSGGYVLIDDVNLGYAGVLVNPVQGYDGVDTGGKTSYTFTALEPDVTYLYSVAGVAGGIVSRPSEQIEVTLVQATGISETAVKDADDGPVAIYDLSGRRLSSAPSHGIYIIKKGDSVKKVIRR